MSGIRRAVMNEMATYPVIDITYVICGYNACTYVNLSEVAHDDNTSYKKLQFEFEAQYTTLDVIRSRKYELRLFAVDPDLLYDTLTVAVTDEQNHTSTKYVPLIYSDKGASAGSHGHTLNLGACTIGREILLSDIIAMDSIYEGFLLEGCRVAGGASYKYQKDIFQIKKDRIKIIGNVSTETTYALVNEQQQRAVVFYFSE